MPIPRSTKDLKIGGADLGAIGIKGERTGRVLAALLLMAARGEIANEKEALLEKAPTIL